MKSTKFLVLAAALAAASCSSSSSSTSDAGDAQLGYGNGPSDAAEAGESGEGGDAAPCTIPSAANTLQPTESGAVGCQSGVGVVCASPMEYRLSCMASDPTLVPPPDPSLGCNLSNNISPTMLNYCCPCK
jgi:hypothetical protein